MNVITEKLPSLLGHFKFGYNVRIGYFEQLASKSSSAKTIYQDFYKNFPDLNDREVRSALGAFLFSGNDVNKELKSLSGGELVRLELCKLLQKRPNVLILDEPTNHMDITSKETLENMLLNYTGTIIFVSHDRYFTSKIATKLLIFDEQGAHIFDGNYSEYSHPSTKIIEKINKEIEQKPKPQKIEYPEDYDENQEPDPIMTMSYYMANKERLKTENQIKKIEKKSSAAESKLKQLNDDFVNPEFASDFIKLMEIQAEIEKTQDMINKFANDWLEKNELLTKLTMVCEKSEKNENNT